MKFNVDDLVKKGLVKKKTYTEGPYAGLSVLKYKNNVFWDNLWDTDPRLLECRGMVVDADDNVVIWPFTKIFNRFENGTDLPLEKEVCVVRKVNGFMAAATVHNGNFLVSTTGTLDSEFAVMAKDAINFERNSRMVNSNFWGKLNLMFEICDKSDPHIVTESPGAYLIGARNKETGDVLSEKELDSLSLFMDWKRPQWANVPFGEAVEAAKNVKHEGYIIRDIASGELLLKIKSSHYLVKKFLMRGGQNKWDLIFDDPKTAKKRVDEEFYSLIDWIRWAYTKDEWSGLTSQERREKIEFYFLEKAGKE